MQLPCPINFQTNGCPFRQTLVNLINHSHWLPLELQPLNLNSSHKASLGFLMQVHAVNHLNQPPNSNNRCPIVAPTTRVFIITHPQVVPTCERRPHLSLMLPWFWTFYDCANESSEVLQHLTPPKHCQARQYLEFFPTWAMPQSSTCLQVLST